MTRVSTGESGPTAFTEGRFKRFLDDLLFSISRFIVTVITGFRNHG